MTSVKARGVCIPSPNEEAYLRHSQLEERRKARLVQVREQEKSLARQLREKVKIKREVERRVLKEHVDAVLAEAHEAELRELEEKYLSRVGSMGQGHRDAQHVNEVDAHLQEENRLQELRLLLEAKQRWRAQDRHAAAMKELSANQLKEKQMRQHGLQRRQQALETEKKRAKQLASAHPPSNQMIVMDFDARKGRSVHFKEAEGYASSYYHIPNPVVERLGTPDAGQPTGQKMAELQTEENQRIEKSAATLQHEQYEKARLRYKHAIAKVKLEKERDEMLAELQSLEREDRASRQKSLAKMPPNIFQPAHRRIEMASEQQREMEGAFERLFVRVQQGTAPMVCSPTEETTGSLSITDQSSSESDLPDHGSPQLERAVNHSPKITPDSGVQIDSTDGSPNLQHTRDLDSGLTSRTTSLGVNKSGVQHTSYSQEGMLTSSTDSSDQSRTHPLSNSMQAPPSRPAWPPRVLPHQDTFSSTDSEQIPTKAAFTQTPRAGGCLVRPGILLDRPELTVTDVTSSDEQSVDGRVGQGRIMDEEKESSLPTKSKRSEGMKALLSMIQAQHQAWNDRLKKRDEVVRSSVSPDTGAKGDHTLEADSLSIYTLSTRESTLSPTAQADRLQQPSLQSALSTSPDQLSISQYHTTFETSAQAPRAPSLPMPTHHWRPSPHSPLPTHHRPPSPLITPPTSQPQPVVTAPQHNSLVPPVAHSLAQTAPASSLLRSNTGISHPLVEHTQRFDMPHSTSTNTPHYTQPTGATLGHASTEDTPRSSNAALKPSTTHATTATASPAVGTSYHTTSSFYSAKQAHSTVTSTPSLDILTTGARDNLLMTSPRPSFNGSHDKLDSFLELPELTAPEAPFLPTVLTTATPTPRTVGSTSVQSSHLPNGPPLDFVLLPPMERDKGVLAANESLGQRNEDPLSQGDADQLSILTLDSSQFSLTGDSPLKSTPVSASQPSAPSAYHLGTHTTTTASPTQQASGLTVKELSVMDTIEESKESDTEVERSNSDSFRGDRIQDEPPLSITGLDNTDFSQSQYTSYVELPSTASKMHSPPQSIHPPVREDQPVYSDGRTQGLTLTKDPPIPKLSQSSHDTIQPPTVHRTALSEEKDVDPSALPVHGLSLQEAFLRRKKEFVKKSQQRIEQIKVNIEEQKTQQAKASSVYSKNSTPAVSGSKLKQRKCLDSGIETGTGEKSQKRHRVVTFSSPLLQKEHSMGTIVPPYVDQGQPPGWLFSKEREKIKKKEMRERNERFYQKLPEVCKRLEEENRKEAYTANRDKARHYQEKIRSKMKDKRVVKKTQPATVMPTTKLKTKPPFK